MFDNFAVFLYALGVKMFLHLTLLEVLYELENGIKQYREKRGISQGKLAEICNVSRQTINAIENNKYDPSLQLAFDIAEKLGVRVDVLFISKGDQGK